ncbi:MAG: polyribonucleotide nucleotidyltransferase, partial [Candidatus Staskawiczbacteria bacterium]|nr:polyribonucleotide nucleotidyltransferase [Candidatus Staskawiczbacteria bacterium]
MIKDTFEINVGGKPIMIKTTNWTEQASGSCLISQGETEVLVTATLSPFTREGMDYFPLTVEYEERFYATGKILGSRFMKREGRATDEAVLNARMIDRAIRPLFPKDFKKEVQVIVTCLSFDGINDPDINGEFIFNPTYEQKKESNMDLTLSAIYKPARNASHSDAGGDGEVLVNMIEMGSKEISEDDVLKATKLAEPEIKNIIEAQAKAVKKIGKTKDEFLPAVELGIENEIKEFLGD